MKRLLTWLLFLLLPALAGAQGDLTGTYPGDTYGGLLHFDGNTGAPAAVPAVVYDGLGNALPMSASQTTVSLTGILTMTQVNAASGSANPFDYTGTLGIMNGSDDFTLFDLNVTNANHTGSSNTVQVIDIAAITGDAEATETAINIGSGWDTGVTSGSPIVGLSVHGELYATSGTWATSSDDPNFVGFTGFTGTVVTGGAYVTADTSDVANDHLIIGAAGAGTYFVVVSASFVGANLAVIECAMFKDTSTETHIGFHRTMGAAAAIGSAVGAGLFAFSAADEPQVKCKSNGNNDLTISDFNLSIYRMN